MVGVILSNLIMSNFHINVILAMSMLIILVENEKEENLSNFTLATNQNSE
jgi:hypothetical protein